MSWLAEAIADGAAGAWLMGEGSGSPADSSGNGRHVTTVGSTPTYGVTGIVPSIVGTAITLDGVAEYFAVPDVGLDFGDTGTYEVWLKILTRTGDRTLVDKGTNSFQLQYDGALKRFRMNANGLGTSLCFSATHDDANLHHVVMTKAGTTRKIYVDGVDETTLGTDRTCSSTNFALNFGREATTFGEYANVTMQAWAVYPTALAAARVTAHHDAGLATNAISAAAGLTPSGALGTAYTSGTPDVTGTPLTSGANNSDLTTYLTASVAPSANKLLLLAVHSRQVGTPASPVITGNGLTWLLEFWVEFDEDDDQGAVWLYRTMGTPFTDAITIAFGATQTGCMWSLAEFGNVDTSGSLGSGAVVGSAIGSDTAGGSAAMSVLLPPFADPRNAAYGAFGFNAASATPGSGFTELSDTSTSHPAGLATEWRPTNDTNVDATASVAAKWGGVAVEIRAVAQGSGGGGTKSTTASLDSTGTLGRTIGRVLETDDAELEFTGSLTSVHTNPGSPTPTRIQVVFIT